MRPTMTFAFAALALLAGCAGHEPPAAPNEPAGPTSGLSGQFLRFAVTTTDPDGDSVAFRFAWGDGDTSDWSGYRVPGDSCARQYAWQAIGSYDVAAQARNRSGAVSEWSPPHPVDIETICGPRH